MNPRIYVACLSAYNHGRLHGEWIDAAQDAESISEEITAMLATSPVPNAEEFAIHDSEEFGDVRIGEYDSIPFVSAIGQALAEHGDAMAAWLANDMPQSVDDAESRIAEFGDAFAGEWDSLRDYADDYLGEIGAHAALEQFGESITVDVEQYARDLELSGAVFTVQTPDHNVYIFRGI